ncbi:unnamed protein product [Candida verbasci]|uniref:Uncharacterized protein n=1 Tax=Candida verbasci TaxID=1227364 RepID=A0A9W4TWY9_9ASCO|nr:unnamed protein product [Candida verbasci]
MNDITIKQLTKRVQTLELKLSTTKNDSITSQLNQLNNKLANLYKEHPELTKLNKLITDLKLWNHLQKRDDEELKLKKEEILLNYSKYLNIISQLNEINKFDHVNLFKNINNLIKSTNIENNQSILESRMVQIKQLEEYYSLILVKCMIVYERYVKLTLAENQYWLDVNKQIMEMSQKINKIESRQMEKSRY